MTIAIALKIGDGLILGADSAVTLANPGRYPDNIYYNAEKIINLVKGLPLGAVTYGLGGFGGRSVTRLAKDLRQRFSDPRDPWWVDPRSFTVEAVAERVKEFFYDDLYRAEFPHGGEDAEFGFIVLRVRANGAARRSVGDRCLNRWRGERAVQCDAGSRRAGLPRPG